MKQYFILPVLACILLVWLTGCESDVENMKPFGSASKLAVTSYISPQDTVVTVYLRMSQPAIGKRLSDEERKVKDAVVTLSDGNSTVTLQYNPERDRYVKSIKDWPIAAGKSYFLSITTPGGLAASASCTVPTTNGVSVSAIDASYNLFNNPYDGEEIRRYNVRLIWADAPQVKNYYRVAGVAAYRFQNELGERYESMYTNRSYTSLYDDLQAKNGTITSDEFIFHGTKINGRHVDYTVYMLLMVCDKNYYQYQHSIEKQQDSDGNPFAEPVVIYSNIKGGVGIFAAYNQMEVSKKL